MAFLRGPGVDRQRSAAAPIHTDVLEGGRGLPTGPVVPHSGGQFTEPWMRRVRDVDDGTLTMLLRTLMTLRRMKLGVAAVGFTLGGLLFGVVQTPNPLHALLIMGTLAGAFGMPLFAVSSLSVRHLFLREGRRHGVSLSASTLIMTRAERRARLFLPWKSMDRAVELLTAAVRDPDTA